MRICITGADIEIVAIAKHGGELGEMHVCNVIFILTALNTEDMFAIPTPTST